MSVSARSRYNYAVRVRRVNSAGALIEFERYDIRPTLVRIVHADNTEYIPQNDDNWSRIAWKTLGDGRLYWIIADFSQVVDPFTELMPETKTSFMTQLSADLLAGTRTQATIVRTKGIQRGMRLRLQDLDPANPNSADVSVMDVNKTTGVMTFSPVTVPTGGIPAALSRVSRIYERKPRLVVPTVHRALFEALDFDNPLNTLVG